MTLIEVIDHRSKVYLLPVGDIHLGAPNVDVEKLKGYLTWAKHEKAYIFLMGDLLDVATLESPTNPFETTMNINEALEFLIELLEPVKENIVGAIEGNHEIRLWKHAGFSLTKNICNLLKTQYCGHSAVLRFRIGKLQAKGRKLSNRVEYIFYAHHSTGGGATLGGKINRAEKLKFIFEGADAYIIGHNHAKALGEESIAYLCKTNTGKASIKYKRVFYIDSGSFVVYDSSYAEQLMLRPSDTGCPRIRMNGNKKDLHISY